MDDKARPAKRRKLSVSSTATTASCLSEDEGKAEPLQPSLRAISPPPCSRPSGSKSSSDSAAKSSSLLELEEAQRPGTLEPSAEKIPLVQPSPIQLTRVDGLPATSNVDTVSLRDILGDPLIKECWAFNYLFDFPWMLTHFDADVRDQIKINLVHGFWKRDDPSKNYMDYVATQYSNVKSVAAYMPEMYGTHHTKMFVLFKHDDTAQVVILTANMLPQDWRMAQAVWRSAPLPLCQPAHSTSTPIGEIGSGSRFKHDLISYLRKYEGRLRSLTEQLANYDFSTVRAALVASAPGRQDAGTLDNRTTLFGWPGLARVLRTIPTATARPKIVSQISSVGTLGVKDDWLRGTLFAALSKRRSNTPQTCDHAIVFPTAGDIRRTHEGYACGGSIHFKTQAPANQKQLAYMRPLLHHWAGDVCTVANQTNSQLVRDAGQNRAGPHIKTYIRFSDASMISIDWAMMTSANLSKQAWGEAKSSAGTVRVCSYEIGVVVWPGLFASGDEQVKMVPAFKADTPVMPEGNSSVIGFRMPYDLPLVPYTKDEDPWCCRSSHSTPDRKGRTWPAQ